MRAPYRGIPLMHHAVQRLSEVCDEVVVVLAPGADPGELPGAIRVVHDPTEGEGPLAGTHAGLLAAVRSELAIVVGGDMPGLQEDVLRAMIRTADETSADAVVLRDGDRIRPLPLVVRTWPAAEAAHVLLHAGRRSLRELVHALTTTVIEEETWTTLDPARQTLLDIDELGDLEA
jgi:molybdopterin-guanine dinucleotide biosynthesis protein A